MLHSWIEAAVVCVLILFFGLLFFLLWDYHRLMRFIRYVNFDPIEFQKLYADGTYDTMAPPLSRKLAEKGVLLSWDSQRRLVALQAHNEPLDPLDYDGMIRSLEEYRNSAALFSEKIGWSLIWYLHVDDFGPAPDPVRRVIASIQRDWREFERQSRFLNSLLSRHAIIENKKT